MFCLIDFSILSINCSHVCIIYDKIHGKISSGSLEVSLSIYPLRNSMDPVFKACGLDLDCLPMLKISKSNAR